ncbi:hypothetical protein ACIA3K_21590 [Micromonospora sp. NPDC051543]|uniref:hypothetical protein n=1 Tax=Micromonospora sp. NPDC051543 TaxID=3364287 RepID=UPI0037A0133E
MAADASGLVGAESVGRYVRRRRERSQARAAGLSDLLSRSAGPVTPDLRSPSPTPRRFAEGATGGTPVRRPGVDAGSALAPAVLLGRDE